MVLAVIWNKLFYMLIEYVENFQLRLKYVEVQYSVHFINCEYKHFIYNFDLPIKR